MRFGKVARILLIIAVIGIIGAMPGCAKKLSVIYFTDSDNDFAGEALERMNYSFTRTYSLFDFYEVFAEGEWDLVVFDNRHQDIMPVEPIMQGLFFFLQWGGKAIVSSIYTSESEYDIIWGEFGFQWKANSTTPISSYRIDPEDDLWNEPNDAPDLNFSGVTDTYGSVNNAFKGAAIFSGSKVATFNQGNPADANAGAVFVANSGRTYFNAFFLDDAVIDGEPIDSDGDNIADAVEWYMNELAALEKVPGERVKMDTSD